jgi:hypothetical protein
MGLTAQPMNAAKQKLSMDQLATYQIQVPGELDGQWSHEYEAMTVTIERNAFNLPVTTLVSRLDQAALQGLLRRLYALGLPIISVFYLEEDA